MRLSVLVFVAIIAWSKLPPGGASTTAAESTTGSGTQPESSSVDNIQTTTDNIQTTTDNIQTSAAASLAVTVPESTVGVTPMTKPGTKQPNFSGKDVKLQFELIFMKGVQVSNDSTTPLPVSTASPLSRFQREAQLIAQLSELYSHTEGFKGVVMNSLPMEGPCQNATYEVFYDLGPVAEKCTPDCKIRSDIETNVTPNISMVNDITCGQIDSVATEASMEKYLASANDRLNDPCLMMPHLCSELGNSFTCKTESETGTVCVDVCDVDTGYCSGGTCSLQKNQHGADEARQCSCRGTSLRMGSDDDSPRCLSYWVVLGPAIGGGFLLVVLILITILCATQNSSTKSSDHQRYEVENPVFSEAEGNKDPPSNEDLGGIEERRGYVERSEVNSDRISPSHIHQTTDPYSERTPQEYPNDYSRMTADELAGTVDVESFKPNLGNVDTSTNYIFRRPKLSVHRDVKHSGLMRI